MLEELRLFQVADKLVELFEAGLLPISGGRAGDLLFRYWRESTTRLSEAERRGLYSRVFGVAGGDPAAQADANTAFAGLWLSFVAAVSALGPQPSVDDAVCAGRDLAENLSLHVSPAAGFAAKELRSQINEIVAILSDSEIRSAFGARDAWQVIDEVATLELGGAPNIVRYRTMATAGALIIRWLARHAATPAPGAPVTPAVPIRDLADACEQWLAVAGTPEQPSDPD